jgi:nicotinamidase-related amidase
MISIAQNTVLLIIDVQKGFDEPVWGTRNNPQAEENIARLLNTWRISKRPVFHVQHLSLSSNSPLRAENPGCEIKDIVKPLEGESLFQKHVNSAFIGTDLEEQLRKNSYTSLVIVGLTTPHCVSTTTRVAGNLGFETYLVSDATAAFELTGHDGRKYSAEEIHNMALATLNGEFATIVESDILLRAFED